MDRYLLELVSLENDVLQNRCVRTPLNQPQGGGDGNDLIGPAEETGLWEWVGGWVGGWVGKKAV